MKKFMRICCFLIAVVCLSVLAVVYTSAEETSYKYGDIDGNGEVKSDDAMHLLFYYIFGDKNYGLNGSADFNQDGEVDIKDVIYLYNHTEDPSSYPLNEPEQHVEHEYTTDNVQSKPANCTDDGKNVMVCKCGDTKVEIIPATGHDWDNEEVTCTLGKTCKTCKQSVPKLGHQYVQTSSTAASCESHGTATFECEVCKDTYSTTTDNALGHTLSEAPIREDSVDGDPCDFLPIYNCTRCEKEFEGEPVSHHNFELRVIEATCVTAGEKIYTCTKCGFVDDKKEVIAISAIGHNWDSGAQTFGINQKITTFSCLNEGCKETKTVVVEEAAVAEVDPADVKQAGSVQLSNTTIELDEAAIENIVEGVANLKLGAETLEGEDHQKAVETLSEDDKEKLGDSPIYNFTMEADGTPVTEFGGTVTVTIPYILEEGEDVDSIIVWYIDSEGNVSTITGAEYNNGFVTFKTTHFSFYTVTKLTPAERCEKFGHNWREYITEATCVADKTLSKICIRCNEKVVETTSNSALGHDYETIVSEDPTCEKSGRYGYKCKRCEYSYKQIVSALGHTWVLNEAESKTATCTTGGYDSFTCSTCGNFRKEEYAATGHKYDTAVVGVGCTTEGYSVSTCSVCSDSYKHDVIQPVGHRAEIVVGREATCTEDGLTGGTRCSACAATIKAQVTIPKGHKPVTVEESVAPGCEVPGKTAKTACSVCNVTIQESAEIPAVGHKNVKVFGKSASCEETGLTDGEMCKNCNTYTKKQEVIPAIGHKFEHVEAKAPTCNNDGNVEYDFCPVCGIAKIANGDIVSLLRVKIAKLGHNFAVIKEVKPTCTVDGAIAHQKCKNCGSLRTSDGVSTTLSAVVLPATGHENQILEALEPTCTTAGHNSGTRCSVCLEAIAGCEEIPAFGHNYVDNICTVCGQQEFDCLHKNNICENFILNGESCADGYTYVRTCLDCNAVDTITVEKGAGHTVFCIKIFDLSSLGNTCGGTVKQNSCACGLKKTSVGSIECNTSLKTTEYDDGGIIHIQKTYTCKTCGVVYVNDYYDSAKNDKCVAVRTSKRTYTFGGSSYVFEDIRNVSLHRNEYTYSDLLDDTCTNYSYTATCIDCGYVASKTITNGAAHVVRDVKHVDFKKSFEMCGGEYIETSCACGKTVTYNLSIECKDLTTENRDYTDENGIKHTRRVRTCSACGMIRDREYWNEPKDENCNYVSPQLNKITVNGVDHIYNWENHKVSHVYIYENFKLNGEDCTSGYTYTRRCIDCNVTTEYDQAASNKHTLRQTAYYDLGKAGACTGYIAQRECACGYNKNITEKDGCNFTRDSFNEKLDENGVLHNVQIYSCNKCGTVVVRDQWASDKDATCKFDLFHKYSYSFKDYSFEINMVEHDAYRHNYVLTDITLNGTSCVDGYTVSEKCVDCGDTSTTTIDAGNDKNHGWWNTEYVDLKVLGTCGGEMSSYRCACGAETGSRLNTICEEVTGGLTTPAENNNGCAVYTYTCVKCNMVWVEERTETRGNTYCEIIAHVKNTVNVGGRSATQEFDETRVAHTYIYRDYVLNNGIDCTGGYTYNRICIHCGNTKSLTYTGTDHITRIREHIELEAFGGCGGNIRLYECACGKESWISYGINCKYSTNRVNKDIDGVRHRIRTRTCDTCGLEWVEDAWDGESTDPCKRNENQIHVIKIKDTEVGRFETSVNYDDHDYVYNKFVLTGKTCGEDFTAYATCIDCRETTTEKYKGEPSYHSTFVVEYIDLKSVGACGGFVRKYECPCKTISYIGIGYDCEALARDSSNYVKDGIDHYVENATCITCGLTYVQDSYNGEKDENCDYIRYATTSISVKGTEYKFETADQYGGDHYYLTVSFKLNGDSCKDGFTVINKCIDCGHEMEKTRDEGSGHVLYLVERINLDIPASCGGYVEKLKCACGVESSLNIFSNCDFGDRVDNSYDDNGAWHNVSSRTCTKCGLINVEDSVSTEKDENCKRTETMIYTYTLGDSIVSFDSEHQYYSHDLIYDNFVLNGTTCMDGYSYTSTCMDCDKVSKYDRKSESDHRYYRIAYLDLAKNGFCGGYISEHRCACGQNGYVNHSYGCKYTVTITDTNTDADGTTTVYRTYTCKTCNNSWRTETVETEKNADCSYYRSRRYIFNINSEEIVIEDINTKLFDHDHVYTFQLKGETCADGYYMTGTCVVCGDTQSDEFTPADGHPTYTIKRIDLKALGACGGYYEEYSCPCGKESGTRHNIECESYEINKRHYTLDGVDHTEWTRTCKCGLVWVEDSYGEQITECKRIMHSNNIVTIGDQSFTFSNQWDNYNHEYIYSNFKLNDSSTCLNGFTAERQCIKCKATNSIEESKLTGHPIYLVERVMLSSVGACGGYVERYSCPCGTEGYVNDRIECKKTLYSSNQYYDESNRLHIVEAHTCEVCGVRAQRDYYEVPDSESCKVYRYGVYTIGKDTVLSYDYIDTIDRHDYDVVATLNSEASSCEDGWTATYTCKNCDHSYTDGGNYHTRCLILEKVDLINYGSACGGTMTLSSCPCGKEIGVIRDTLCDLSLEKLQDPWIEFNEDAAEISYDGSTIHYAQNKYGVYTCAVTDPHQCGFTMLYQVYWVKDEDTCTYRQHIAYKVGDGENAKILDYETGRVYYIHMLTTEKINTTEGEYTVTGNKRVCSDCGSVIEEKSYYLNGVNVNHVSTATVTCVDEQIARNFKGYTRVIEYDENGWMLKTEYVRETYDGSEFYYTTTYTYEGCTQISTTAGTEYPEPVTERYEHHTRYGWVTVTNSTCSQPGLQAVKCSICEGIVESRPIAPKHKWKSVSDNLYRCSICGLENTNGADGAIVMEDLTDSLGGTDYYVVGYYNKNNVTFTSYVSLALKTPLENGDNEVILNGITVEDLADGTCAIRFSRAAVAAAAEALGYTADQYDVRFTFVPEGADGSFDYAITFTA